MVDFALWIHPIAACMAPDAHDSQSLSACLAVPSMYIKNTNPLWVVGPVRARTAIVNWGQEKRHVRQYLFKANKEMSADIKQ